MKVEVKVIALKCERCSHLWIPQTKVESMPDGTLNVVMKEPNTCPQCRSPYWDRPRRIRPQKV